MLGRWQGPEVGKGGNWVVKVQLTNVRKAVSEAPRTMGQRLARAHETRRFAWAMAKQV